MTQYKYTFISPKIIAKIEKKVKELAERWDYPQDQQFQLWQMVATIESGLAEKTFYKDDGIVFDGWNGYRDYDGSCNVDPYRAWGGFYRMEKSQWVGWTIYMTIRPEVKPEDRGQEFKRVAGIYRLYNLIWEDTINVWGWRGYQSYYTEAEAQLIEQEEKERVGYKRSSIEYSDMSGCYHLIVENSRCKPNLKSIYQHRIEA